MQIWIGALFLMQLVVGTLWISVLYAQPRYPAIDHASLAQQIEQQQTKDKAAELERRLTDVERLGLDARVKVLEDMKTRMDKIELLAYGQILSICGVLILGILQVKGQKGQRQQT